MDAKLLEATDRTGRRLQQFLLSEIVARRDRLPDLVKLELGCDRYHITLDSWWSSPARDSGKLLGSSFTLEYDGDFLQGQGVLGNVSKAYRLPVTNSRAKLAHPPLDWLARCQRWVRPKFVSLIPGR